MSFNDVWRAVTNGDVYRQWGDWSADHVPGWQYVQNMFGYTQMRNVEKSTTAQIDYEQYLKGGNERALADWYKNVGSQGRTIKYPEFSYAGQIYRGDTAIARAGFDYSNAAANYYGNLPYRTAGLYGIAGKLSRTL